MIEPEAKPSEAAPQAEKEGASRSRERVDLALGLVAALLPVALALSVASGGRDYAHDLALLRTVGAAGTGSLRALDAVAYAPFTLLPFGTTAFRLTLGSAFFAGLAGHLAYQLARQLYDALFGPRWACVGLALIASLAASMSAPFLLEASAPAGSTLAACLALAPLALMASVGPRGEAGGTVGPRTALLVGLAAFYEPMIGLAALASVAPLAWARRGGADAGARREPGSMLLGVGAFAVGVLPAVASFVRAEGSALPRVVPLLSEPLGEAGLTGATSLAAFYHAHLGVVLGALVVGGAALSVHYARIARGDDGARARTLSAGLFALVAVAVLALVVGAPAHGARFAGVVLAGLAAGLVFAGAALLALVERVATADIPFARASATMIVLLELVLPVRQADEAFTLVDARSPLATPLLAIAEYGSLPSGTAIVTHEPRALLRILAARESGDLRSDVVVAPTFDLGSRLAREALAVEPLLAGVYRDVALGGRPEEFALSELSRSRPLSLAFDPGWDRALARHLVSAGMATVFEAEPRGSSDRVLGIEAFAPLRQKLAQNLLPAGRDPERLHVVVKMLRTRAIALGAGGEKAVLGKALDDLRALSREDPIADELTRRIVLAKGPIDVRDLHP